MGKMLLIAVVLLGVVTAGVFWADASETLLFDTTLWAIAAAAGLGFLLGAIRASVKGREEIVDGEVTRHGGGAFIGHWGTAVGIFVLLASAFLLGFLFITGQVNTPGEALFPLNLHFIGVVVTLFSGFLFAGDFLFSGNLSRLIPNLKDITEGTLGKYVLRAKWHNEGKYLSSQKSAFVAFASLGAAILLTGGIKVASHIWAIQASMLSTITYVHDMLALLFVVMLVVHLLFVLALPDHWPQITSWLTGKVPEEYAKSEHPLWYEELKKNE